MDSIPRSSKNIRLSPFYRYAKGIAKVYLVYPHLGKDTGNGPLLALVFIKVLGRGSFTGDVGDP